MARTETKAPVSTRRIATHTEAAQSRAATTMPCPECKGTLPPNTSPMGTVKVCPYCAAIYMTDAKTGGRTLKTQEYMDLLCNPGHDHVFIERDRVISQLREPPRGLMKTTVSTAN